MFSSDLSGVYEAPSGTSEMTSEDYGDTMIDPPLPPFKPDLRLKDTGGCSTLKAQEAGSGVNIRGSGAFGIVNKKCPRKV